MLSTLSGGGVGRVTDGPGWRVGLRHDRRVGRWRGSWGSLEGGDILSVARGNERQGRRKLDATRRPTGPEGRAESRLRTTQHNRVRLPAFPCLLETNRDHEKANGTMKSKNRLKIARSSQTGSKLRTEYTMGTDGTIARQLSKFWVLPHASSAYFAFAGISDTPSRFLRLPGAAERRRSIRQLPGACRPCRPQEPANHALHWGFAVCPLVLRQRELVPPPPPARGQHPRHGPARGGDPPTSG